MDVTVERIINLLDEKNIMAKTFCEDLELNKSSVVNWKNGFTKSYTKSLDKIADYLCVSVEYLLGNTKIKNKPITNEGDELYAEAINLMDRLSPELQEQAMNHLRFLVFQKENAKTK